MTIEYDILRCSILQSLAIKIIMTPFKVSSVFNTRINHKLSKYIFLEIFILIALFCSHFTQGNVDFKFIHAQKTIPVPYQLYISFCDNDLECFINESRQIFSDNICSNIMCSSIVRNRTINCQEKVSTSINDNLILDLRCNILEKRHIQLVKRQSNFFDSNILKSFQVQRRLLSKSKTKSRRPRVTKTTKVLPKNDSIVIDSIVTVAEGEAESDGFAQTTKEPFNYTKFREVVEYLNKGRSVFYCVIKLSKT